MFDHEMKIEEVFEFYRARANAENFIHDQKYGFHLKHFPYQKPSANYVYRLIIQMAHNPVFVVDRSSTFGSQLGVF